MVNLFGTDTLFLRKLLVGLEGEEHKSQVEAWPLGPGDDCMCVFYFLLQKEKTVHNNFLLSGQGAACSPQRERCVSLFQEHYMSTLHNGFYVIVGILDRFWIEFKKKILFFF